MQHGSGVICLQNNSKCIVAASLLADSPRLWSAVCHRPRLCEAEQLQPPQRHGVSDHHPHQSSSRQSEVRQSWQNLCRQVLPLVHHGCLPQSDVGDHCTRDPANQFGSVTGSCPCPHVGPILSLTPPFSSPSLSPVPSCLTPPHFFPASSCLTRPSPRFPCALLHQPHVSPFFAGLLRIPHGSCLFWLHVRSVLQATLIFVCSQFEQMQSSTGTVGVTMLEVVQTAMTLQVSSFGTATQKDRPWSIARLLCMSQLVNTFCLRI